MCLTKRTFENAIQNQSNKIDFSGNRKISLKKKDQLIGESMMKEFKTCCEKLRRNKHIEVIDLSCKKKCI